MWRLQLDPAANDWRLMDLRVEQRYGVDVKNLRRSRHGGEHSSRWKVKAFKTDARGTEVLLCGVSSPYTTLDEKRQLRCKDGAQMTVLGVTTATETKKLLQAFGHIYRLQVSAGTKLVELPAWSWDYPNAHYHKRNTALRELRDWVKNSQLNPVLQHISEAVPPVLSVLLGMSFSPKENEHTAEQRAFLTMLKNHLQIRHVNDSGRGLPRLPELYLYVLHFWLHWRSQKNDVNTPELARLFQWGFPVSRRSPRAENSSLVGSKAKSMTRSSWQPLSLSSSIGVVDPTDTIGVLLDALGELEKNLDRSTFLRLSDLCIFENGVLVGTFPEGRRRTLLAHCGGKDVLNNQADCGLRSLVFGREKSCACGRLICPQCECCGDPRFSDCAQQQQRLELRLGGRHAPAEPRRLPRAFDS